MPFLEHGIGLSRTGRGGDVDGELSSLARGCAGAAGFDPSLSRHRPAVFIIISLLPSHTSRAIIAVSWSFGAVLRS
jgi:hypothetical protein